MIPQKVLIYWIDSTSKFPIWQSPETVAAMRNVITESFETIGFLVEENKLEYIIAGSIHYSDKKIQGFGQIFTIQRDVFRK